MGASGEDVPSPISILPSSNTLLNTAISSGLLSPSQLINQTATVISQTDAVATTVARNATSGGSAIVQQQELEQYKLSDENAISSAALQTIASQLIANANKSQTDALQSTNVVAGLATTETPPRAVFTGTVQNEDFKITMNEDADDSNERNIAVTTAELLAANAVRSTAASIPQPTMVIQSLKESLGLADGNITVSNPAMASGDSVAITSHSV